MAEERQVSGHFGTIIGTNQAVMLSSKVTAGQRDRLDSPVLRRQKSGEALAAVPQGEGGESGEMLPSCPCKRSLTIGILRRLYVMMSRYAQD